jgi:endonuclease YncB( thermonuclease family)
MACQITWIRWRDGSSRFDDDRFEFEGESPMWLRFLLLLLALMANEARGAIIFGGVVSFVTDGDTLWVQPDTGGPTRKIRISGIDAPEICQAGGEASRDALIQFALKRRVMLTVSGKDIYGRGVARIQLGGQDLGSQMVRSGQAWSYRSPRSAGPYAAEEAAAQQSRLGLFASGQPINPRNFRKQHGSCHHAKRRP